jgi:hypothetical protein
MNEIEELGDQIELAYCAAQYDERQFPAIAQRALEAHSLHRSFDIAQLMTWAYRVQQIPSQPQSSFGEPPVLMYCGRRFYIEALFWLDGTTSIHQHSFSGAFQVLQGSSIHTRFRFETEHAINKALLLGRLDASSPELLQIGDTRAIQSGDGLIHSTFHLDRPSVTLVVRTYVDEGKAPQYSYLRPGVALSGFYYDARLPRLLQLFELLFRASVANRKEIVREFLDRSDLHSSIVVLNRLVFIARAELDTLTDAVIRRHPIVRPYLVPALDELRRERLVTRRRATAKKPQHRYFLALLLNVAERDEILRLIAAINPDCEPIDQIMQWVEEMSDADGGDNDVLGYHLGPAELGVLRLLLRRCSIDEILVKLADDYEDVSGNEQRIKKLCARLKKAALFRSLLQDHAPTVEEGRVSAA